MTELTLRERGALVDALSSSVTHGEHNWSNAVGALRRVIEEDAWREWITKRQEVVTPKDFAEFVTKAPLKGLGLDNVDILRRIVGDDVVMRDRLDELLRNGPGRPRKPVSDDGPETLDNVQSFPSGNSEAAALRRLRKPVDKGGRPDLLAQVLAGELSPHAAAIKAGFRHPTITVRADDADAAVRALARRYSRDELLAALERQTVG